MADREGMKWDSPATVAGFAQSPPNAVLMRFAQDELARVRAGRALDLGCGAARNAAPLAQMGWDVAGIDDSAPMLVAAAQRARQLGVEARVRLALASMDRIPLRERSCDLIVAHGIWNLARSAEEFRRAVREAARVARPHAGLFVFTFSRNTLPPAAQPVAGETFVFTAFSGQPQCFLTAEQLVAELGAAGFAPHPGVPLTEYNRPKPGSLVVGRGPVIHEAAFSYRG